MTDTAHDAGFVEVADRCWVARYEYLDVNVGLVGGDRGLVVVDTHASQVHAEVVLEQVRRLGAGEVVAVVNTHAHFDHFFGNAVFAEAYVAARMIAHEAAARDMPQEVERVRLQAAERGEGQPDADREEPVLDDAAATRVLVPAETFSSARVVDLGDRLVELIHPGRGHTAGDIVVRVPDVDVLFAGDLVEEATARDAVPGFGEDCYPLDWPATLDLVLSMLSDGSVVVPGHGAPVDKDFVLEQRGSVGMVAETIRDLAGRGVHPEEMAPAADWPYPVTELVHAFARGYAQLPASARSLPLL